MLNSIFAWMNGVFPINFLEIHLDGAANLMVSISIPLLILLAVPYLVIRALLKRTSNFKAVELEISLGGVGKVKLVPNFLVIQIAHKIRIELVTRKAAITIDPEHDVITEIYDSWYTLFGQIRALISEIPAEQIKTNQDTKMLVQIATQTLNEGLRPHLTKWQARFRNWYLHHDTELVSISPQELQKRYPDYKLLTDELLLVNQNLIAYAEQLRLICEE